MKPTLMPLTDYAYIRAQKLFNVYFRNRTKLTVNYTISEDNMYISDQNISNNIFFMKFKQWLADEVQLEEYLPKFIETGSADIKLIKFFDDQMLMAIGIDNIAHRKRILAEAKSFKQA
eukprot:520481_1